MPLSELLPRIAAGDHQQTASTFTSADWSAYYDNTGALLHPPGSGLVAEQRLGSRITYEAECLQVLCHTSCLRQIDVP